MDVQDGGGFNQFQSHGLDPGLVDIIHRFELRRLQKIPLCVYVNPVRLIEHNTELGIPLRDNVDGAVWKIPISYENPLLFSV